MHRSRIAYFTVDVDDLDVAVKFWSSALGAIAEPGAQRAAISIESCALQMLTSGYSCNAQTT